MTEEFPSEKEMLQKIKTHGYWEISIRPLKFQKERISSLNKCKEIVEESKVRLRGWDYPHISRRYGIRSGNNWVQNLTDFEAHVELWRMYQSGQFYHLFGCWEDWWGKVRIFWSDQQYTTPNYGLCFLCTLYTLTEIYEFAFRAAKHNIFNDSFKLDITLHGMKNRRIVTLDIRRSLNSHYICNIDEIPLTRTVSVPEIVEKRNEFAIDDTISIFERFNWFNPPRQVLAEEQDKYLKGIN